MGVIEMWMTDHVREAKRQLEEVFGLIPSSYIGKEPCFDNVANGIYPMMFDGKQEYVVIVEGRFFFDMRMMDKK